MSATEYRVENETGWLLNRESGETTPWQGIRICWRFVGERKWRKRSIIADPEQGQTQASLRESAAKIVDVLASKVETP
ncbi:MAG: hypothetical protein NUW01_16170 [Gemmatimonadaceae bacterium]|nr:hypothetical protein [Gemmatimonadaceae bacterium]